MINYSSGWKKYVVNRGLEFVSHSDLLLSLMSARCASALEVLTASTCMTVLFEGLLSTAPSSIPASNKGWSAEWGRKGWGAEGGRANNPCVKF